MGVRRQIGETEVQSRDRGMGFLERGGQRVSPHQLGDLGSAVRGPGRSLSRLNVFLHSVYSRRSLVALEVVFAGILSDQWGVVKYL